MTNKKAVFVPVSCNNRKCPQFSTCPQLPTEINYVGRNHKRVEVLLVGEAGGREEESYKRPFVGRSGILLRNVISHVQKLYGEKSYAISNICRFRPTDSSGGNRKPEHSEIKRCLKYLIRDIGYLKPKIICALGETPHNVLAPESGNLKDIRGRVLTITVNGEKYSYVGTYHPAWILRNPEGIVLLVSDIKVAFSGMAKYFNIGRYDTLVIDSLKKFKGLVDTFLHRKSKYIVVDVETANTNRIEGNRLLSIQFCSSEDKVAYFVPYGHKDCPFSPGELKKVRSGLVDLFTNPDAKFKYWIAHNAKFDITIIQNLLGINIVKPVLCTMTYAYLLEENYGKYGQYGLKYIASRFGFDYPPKYLSARSSDLEEELTFEEFADYGCMDVYVTKQVFEIFNRLAKREKFYKKAIRLLIYLYSRLYKVISHVETKGIAIDRQVLRTLKGSDSPINTLMKNIEEELRSLPSVKKANDMLVGGASISKSLFGNPWVFDINKEESQRTLFFKVLKLEPLSYGKKRESINKAFQSEYKDVKEVKLFSDYTKLKKLKTGYVSSIYEFLDTKLYPDNRDGRVHPSFYTTTVTGRLRAEDPNPQQIPRPDTPLKRAVKNLYCAPPGRVLVEIDNMASEVRVFGMVSEDSKMIEIFSKAKKYRDKFRKNENNLKLKKKAEKLSDFHSRMAKITKLSRSDSKAIVFGGIYGRTNASMAAQIGCSPEEAKEKFSKIFGEMKEANKWLHEIERFAEENLYVENPIGRRRRLYEFLFGTEAQASSARRKARNSPIQAFSTDLSSLAVSIFYEEYMIPNNKLTWYIINLIHDASVFEVGIDDIAEFVEVSEPYFTTKLEEAVERDFGYKLPLPMEVEYKIGTHSGDMMKWDFTTSGLNRIIEEVRKEDKKRKRKWIG